MSPGNLAAPAGAVVHPLVLLSVVDHYNRVARCASIVFSYTVLGRFSMMMCLSWILIWVYTWIWLSVKVLYCIWPESFEFAFTFGSALSLTLTSKLKLKFNLNWNVRSNLKQTSRLNVNSIWNLDWIRQRNWISKWTVQYRELYACGTVTTRDQENIQHPSRSLLCNLSECSDSNEFLPTRL